MSEQQPDMQPATILPEEERKLSVFAVRIDPGLREQLEALRGITGQSVNEVGVEALAGWVVHTLSDETVRKKAMAGIEAEERRLQERRNSIAAILGIQAPDASAPSETVPEEAESAKRGGK